MQPTPPNNNALPPHHAESQIENHTQHSEQKVSKVFILTTVTMFIEIIAGVVFGSMALLADGWHMFTHSAAFAIALFAYSYARKHKNNPGFAFGTGKVTSLGGFASAVALAVVALFMAMESVERLVVPHTIHFNEAIWVAILGLGVNVASVFLLHDHGHGHSHGHGHGHGHHEHNHDHSNSHKNDHNLKAAYFHVLADTLTSVLAIVALVAGKHLGWVWMDALMGIVGAAVISKWAYNLLKESSGPLLDRTPSCDTADQIKALIEHNSTDKLIALRIWRVTANESGVIVTIASENQSDPNFYKQRFETLKLAHVTIELHPLPKQTDTADNQQEQVGTVTSP